LAMARCASKTTCTAERTALSYLVKPLRDQITRAFTEQ
jgi:hypothetical protein